jgi:hypothetical protein
MPGLPHQATLIATVDQDPEVVLTSLDWLARAGWPLSSVVALCAGLERSRQQAAARDIQERIKRGMPRAEGKIEPVVVPLTADGRAVRDIRSAREAAAVFRAICALVEAEHGARRAVHLSLAGALAGVSALCVAAAHLLFDSSDHLWLVSASDAEERDQARGGHAVPGAALVALPVLRLSLLSPAIRMLIEAPDGAGGAAGYRALEYRARCRLFLDQLTPAERGIVERLVRDPSLSNLEIGACLHYSGRVVGNYLTAVYDKARAHYGLRSEAVGKREVLVGLLAPYYAWLDLGAATADQDGA